MRRYLLAAVAALLALPALAQPVPPPAPIGETGRIRIGATIGGYSVKDATFGAKGDGSTDDSAAFLAACTAAAARGDRYLTVPQGVFNVPTLAAAACANVIFVGQGSVLAYRKWVFDPTLPAAPFPGPTITAGQMPMFTAAKNPVVVVMGDSTCSDYPGANTVSSTDYLYAALHAKIVRDNAGRNVTIYNRCVGGQTFNSAHGVASSNWPSWYANHALPWFSTYVAPLAPDLIIWDFGVNEAAAPSSTLNASANMRATVALAQALPKKPDMIFVTPLPGSTADPLQNTQVVQEDHEWVAGVIRSYAAKNGFGVLDNGRRVDQVRDGFDPLDQALGCFVSSCPSTGIIPSAWPFVWPSQTRDFSVNMVSLGDVAGFWNSLTSMTFTLSQDPNNVLILTNSGGFLAYTVIADNVPTTSIPLTVTTIPIASDNGAGNIQVDVSVRTDAAGSHLVVVYSTLLAADVLIDRAGGLFTPQVSIVGTLTDNMFAKNVTVSTPKPYMPQMTDFELCGSLVLGGQWGGSGCPHLASRGNRDVLVPVIEANVIGAATPVLGTAHNKLINGNMVLDQSHEGTNQNGTIASQRCTDKWFLAENASANRAACQRFSTTPPAGFSSYLAITQITATTALTAAQWVGVQQTIEGPGIEDLSWGTADASPIHVGVWLQVNNAGTYDLLLKSNATGIRSYLHEVTLPAGVWTYVSYTVPGDIAAPGSWVVTPGASSGLVLSVNAGCGSTAQTTTLDAWQFNATARCTAGSTQIITITGGSIWMTGATLIKGAYDLPVIGRTYGETLALAQRYFAKTFPSGTAPAQSAGLAGAFCARNPIAAGEPSGFLPAPVRMAVTPTVTTYNPSAANANWRDVTAAADATVSVDPATALGPNGVLLATAGTVATLGDTLCIHATFDAGF